jgi:hypothetical protein
LGLDVDLAFLDRPDWQKPGPDAGRRFQLFCPLSAVTEKRRVSKSKQSSQVSAVSPPFSIDEKSALAQQYDLELHQMVAYMRRLDGAYALSPQGEKCMDPFARDGESKWTVVNGSKIPPLFGFWGYYAWEHVLGVVFSSSFGSIFTVSDARGLKELMAAEVMM